MEDLGPPAGQMGRRMTEALGQSHRDQVWAGASEHRCPGRTWTVSVGGKGAQAPGAFEASQLGTTGPGQLTGLCPWLETFGSGNGKSCDEARAPAKGTGCGVGS